MSTKDNDESSVERIREECLSLFSSKNIFYNCGADLIQKYKNIFQLPNVRKVIENEELLATVNIFFDNSLNISTASKLGYMHRNTLVYRLDKLKSLIGLDVRTFNDAVVFGNLILFYNLIKHDLY